MSTVAHEIYHAATRWTRLIPHRRHYGWTFVEILHKQYRGYPEERIACVVGELHRSFVEYCYAKGVFTDTVTA